MKTTTIDKVDARFSRMTNDMRQKLVQTNEYWYEVSTKAIPQCNLLTHASVRRGRPTRDEVIIDILKERYFPQEFLQNVGPDCLHCCNFRAVS
jgi:hypothetical protein